MPASRQLAWRVLAVGVCPVGTALGRRRRQGGLGALFGVPSAGQVVMGVTIAPCPSAPGSWSLPCRLVLAGTEFVVGAWCVAGMRLVVIKFPSFREVNMFKPQRVQRHQGHVGMHLMVHSVTTLAVPAASLPPGSRASGLSSVR